MADVIYLSNVVFERGVHHPLSGTTEYFFTDKELILEWTPEHLCVRMISRRDPSKVKTIPFPRVLDCVEGGAGPKLPELVPLPVGAPIVAEPTVYVADLPKMDGRSKAGRLAKLKANGAQP